MGIGGNHHRNNTVDVSNYNIRHSALKVINNVDKLLWCAWESRRKHTTNVVD